MDYFKLYKKCRLCPRECGTDRTDLSNKAGPGFCGETNRLRIAYIGPHYGEEPPITGKNGSGTIFLTGCPLKCSFCQNYQISQHGLGKEYEMDDVVREIDEMIRFKKVHNLNIVSPDHFFPHVFSLVSCIRLKHSDLPVVFNLSGYQSLDLIRVAEDFADIYLPDFKYSDSFLAARLSACPDYPEVSLNAIEEMVKQKGFLDVCSGKRHIGARGVLVRHLILPGYVENSIKALSSLFLEFGRGLPLSLMSQYYPVRNLKLDGMNRTLRSDEFEKVYNHCLDLGFENLFVQFPGNEEDTQNGKPRFIPDFRLSDPFIQAL